MKMLARQVKIVLAQLATTNHPEHLNHIVLFKNKQKTLKTS